MDQVLVVKIRHPILLFTLLGNSKSVPILPSYLDQPIVSISSGQQNLMKTYQNEANTSGITKSALKKFWDFSDKVDRLAKLQKSDFQSHFFMSKLSQPF